MKQRREMTKFWKPLYEWKLIYITKTTRLERETEAILEMAYFDPLPSISPQPEANKIVEKTIAIYGRQSK